MEVSYVHVAVLAPIDPLLTYQVPPELASTLKKGMRVIVPLGRRRAMGIIMEETKEPPPMAAKPLEALLDDEPILSPLQLKFLEWASRYYLAPLGELIRTALPADLTRIKKTASKTPRSLKEKNTPSPLTSAPTLTEAQKLIVEKILSLPQVHLVHGITGSGKTEIYLDCIEKVLKQNRQAICLVPEIGLTPQGLIRYSQRFGNQVGIYHSDLSNRERLRIWQQCRSGEISMVLGTRSALFLPFHRLGILIVDEEHDSSYKQEERVRYHARDLAIVRASLEKIPIVLGSATPSVETYYKAQTGKFLYHALDQRFGGSTLPSIEVVDLREQSPQGAGDEKKKSQIKKKNFPLLSPRLLEEIALNLGRKEQTLLFLNRRGFSHFLLCEDCGETPRCINCEITLTFHQRSKKLICHYCDYQLAAPRLCPSCKGGNWLPVGSGTERIEEDLQDEFPEAKIARMDRDTTSRKGSHESLLEKFAARQIDILIGTQMIAKGHDYPHVTLVGILLADTALHHPDFRAGEQTFQLITQVSGRAGRSHLPGRVILQTFSTDHYSIQAATHSKIKEFYAQELDFRKELHYPPFKRLLTLRLQGTRREKVMQGIAQIHEKLEKIQRLHFPKMEILGPSPCLIEKLRNVYRWQILVKSETLLHSVLQKEILETHLPWMFGGLRLILDMDPIHVV